jgi:hypothetical protein
MSVVASMAFLVAPAFFAGVIATLIFNHIALVKWRRETQPHKERWYHTWSRR